MTSPAADTFGSLVRDQRVAAGLSQEALAERAGLSVESVSALERGVRRAPYRATVDRLAAALGLDAIGRERLDRTIARTRTPRSDVAPPPFRLPAYGTRFVGRHEDAAALRDALDASRIVTVCGAGGVGKTRLAVEVGRGQRTGGRDVRFVSLASLRDGGLVTASIAAAFGIDDMPDTGDGHAFARAMATREALVVLDNCEHLIEAAARAAEIIVAFCPGVDVLATSRRPLLVDGEVIYRLDPLAPDESTELFLDRARAAVRPKRGPPVDRSRARAIARALDGVPFAIELAAALLRSGNQPADTNDFVRTAMSLDRAERRTAIEHHRSLDAMIAWSVDALEPVDRRALTALAVPIAGTSPDGARALVGADAPNAVARLCDVSLLWADERGRVGLHQTTREFVMARADPRDVEAAEARFNAWLAEALSDAAIASFANASYVEFGPLLAELDNVRELARALVRDPKGDLASHLAVAADYWTAAGRAPEGYRRYVDIRAALVVDGDLEREAALAFAQAMCAIQSGLGAHAGGPAGRAAEIARTIDAPLVLGRANVILGHVALAAGRLEEAAERFATAASVLAAAGLGPWAERASYFSAVVAIERDRIDEAETLVETIVRVRSQRSRPPDASDDALLSIVRAGVSRARGLHEHETRHAREALAALDGGPRTTMFARATLHLVDALRAEGVRHEALRTAAGEIVELSERGFTSDVALLAERCAAIALDLGDGMRASRLASFAEATLRETTRTRMRTDRTVRAEIEAALGTMPATSTLATSDVLDDLDVLVVRAREHHAPSDSFE